MTVGDIISRDNSDASISVSAGQTLWHPNLDIQTGHTYSIAGQMVLVDELTGAGTVDGDGTVFDTSTDLTGYSRLDANESVTGGKTFSQRIEALGGIYSVDVTTFGSNLKFAKSSETLFSADTSDGADNKRIVFCGGGANGATRGASLELAGNENGDAGAFYAVSGTGAAITFAPAGTAALTLNSTGTASFAQNIIMANGKGIDFSATSDGTTMTGEVLSDYEEGTWTPTLTDLTNNATMGGTNAGTYTKIGNTVHLRMRVEVSSLASTTTSSAAYIKTLPFTVSNANDAYSGCGLGYAINFNMAAAYTVSIYAEANTNQLRLRKWDVSTGTSDLTIAEVSADGTFFVELSYRTT